MTKDKKKSIIVYLAMKGKWSNPKEEANNINDIFGIGYLSAKDIVDECVREGIITFSAMMLNDYIYVKDPSNLKCLKLVQK